MRTNNPRSLAAEDLAARMRTLGLAATPCATLRETLSRCAPRTAPNVSTLVCGSLFLAGEALVELGAYPWSTTRFDPSERLRA